MKEWWIKPRTLTITGADEVITTQIAEEVTGHDDDENDDMTQRVNMAAVCAADLGYAAGMRAGLRRGFMVMAAAVGDKDADRLLQLHRAMLDDQTADAILLEFVKSEEGGITK